MEEVIGSPIKQLPTPNILPLTKFVIERGGPQTRPRWRTEGPRPAHVRGLVKAKRGGKNLHDAAVAAQEAGYFAEYHPDTYTTEEHAAERPRSRIVWEQLFRCRA